MCDFKQHLQHSLLRISKIISLYTFIFWGGGIIGILFSSPLYDKVCFSTSNNMNSPSFHSSHYFNSPKKLCLRVNMIQGT